MPSVSDKQKKFMLIASKDKAFAARNNIPQAVAKEFHEADKAKDYQKTKRKKRYDNK